MNIRPPGRGAALALLVLTLAAAAAAAAQELPYLAPLPPHVRVGAEAVITARPDRAELDVGVVTQAPKSQEAAAQNARQLDAVLAALRKRLGAKADIRTISYSLSPNYRYPREGGEPILTGYTAMNTVRVTLDDLTQVGVVIDTATQAGANQVQRVQFTLKDEEAARAQALRQAAQKARAQAEALAASLGVKIVRVLAAVDSGQPVQPLFRDVAAARAEMSAVPTPVEPGTIEVRANVTLTVEITAR